jgi:hypothetical protein
MKINRQLRKDALDTYGYVEFKIKPIPQALQNPRNRNRRYHLQFNSVIFHPEVDMLCATSRTRKEGKILEDSLEQCGALHRLRSIAIHSYTLEKLCILKAFPRLELVFVNIRHATIEPNQDQICRYNIAEYDDSVYWVAEAGLERLDSDSYRQRLQEVAARGTKRIAPHIEIVEQDFR